MLWQEVPLYDRLRCIESYMVVLRECSLVATYRCSAEVRTKRSAYRHCKDLYGVASQTFG